LRLLLGLPADMQLGVAAGSSKNKQQLLTLATCSLQLWEAKRLMRCNSHMPARARGLITPTHEAVARAILRVDVASSSSSSGSRHSSRVEAAEVKKQYKESARAVHPDKVPKELQGVEGAGEAFTEGFKVLQAARDVLLGGSK
jgi:hypothetical protein